MAFRNPVRSPSMFAKLFINRKRSGFALHPRKFKVQRWTSNGANKGFTLIEMLVYIAILIIIAFVLTAFIFWTISSNTKIKVKHEVLDNTRRAMEIMTYEVKEAKSVYTPTSVFGLSPGQLSLETTHNLPNEEKTTYLDFYLCNQQICLKRENNEPIAITSDKTIIDNLVFSRVLASSTETVQINLGLRYNNPVNRPEWQASTTLVTTITLRGY